MSEALHQVATIASKEIADARRTRLLVIVTLFMLGAGGVALTVAGIAMRAEVAAYASARELLLSLGKSAEALAAPSFRPLGLLRGFIEYVEILGSVLGIVLGHRAAASERSGRTLALLLTRPLSARTFIAGKCLGALAVVAVVLAATLAFGAVGIVAVADVALDLADVARIASVLAAATLYVGFFMLVGFLLSLSMRRSSHSILLAFGIWITFVLVVPQVGDTLDPDNQVGAGVFRTLGIAKPDEKRIMQSFATYETLRDGIEQSSPAKHFERWSFAILGIKETYAGQSFGAVLADRRADLLWLLGLFGCALAVLFARPLDIPNLIKE